MRRRIDGSHNGVSRKGVHQDRTPQTEIPWKDPKYDYRRTFVKDRDMKPRFKEIFDRLGPEVPEEWKTLVNVPDDVDELIKFSDVLQPVLKEKPLPDGSNLHQVSPMLPQAWAWYRDWLTFLHLESMLVINHVAVPSEWHGFERLRMQFVEDRVQTKLMNGLAPNLLNLIETEKDSKPEGHEDVPVDGLHWLLDWRRDISEGMANIYAASAWAREMNRDELGAMKQVYETIPTGTKVLVQLLAKEKSFEWALYFRHVEDEHVIKRLRLVSKHDLAFFWPTDLKELHDQLWANLVSPVHSVQHAARSLYHYRLLRDWGYGRPWARLHLIFDTNNSASVSQAVNMIQQVHLNAQISKRSADLFGVHPLPNAGPRGEELCSICSEAWKVGDLLMETHCHHHFHASCLISWFDQPLHHNFTCPLCRHTPGRLRDRVVFPAERTDAEPGSQDAMTHDTWMEAIEGWLEGGAELYELPAAAREAWAREEEIRRLAWFNEEVGRGEIP